MSLYVKEFGNKNAEYLVMFIHGGGVSGWMWDEQVNYFKNYYCLVPDLPEHGKSKSAGIFSMKNSAQLLLELLEEKAYGKKVIVIGFSLGAQVLIQMVSMKPEIIHYAMINSALVRPLRISKYVLKPTLKLTFPLVKNKTFSKLQAKSLFISKEYFADYYKESSEMSREGLIRILEENMAFSIPKQFSQAKVHILVTVGERERGIMKKSAIDLVKSNQYCQGILINKIGHGMPLANPELFYEIIENWITGKDIPSN